MPDRLERVKELLKSEISEIIRREIKDPRLGFVTITDAEVSKDLRHAKIFISVLGDEQKKQETLNVLQSAAGFIRGEFGRHARMKIIPEITFKLDTTVERGARIFELLEQVKRDEEQPPSGN
ncbi:MAG: 30S ribosome-binding factor RbfA [Armatimonadota bacterium]|nr:30S ribosome-binding factor RbfA [Armatimonadota bacterium]